MRPSGRFPVTDASYEDRGTPPRAVRLVDDDAIAPWTAYLYRVVARGPDGGAATRSAPSAAVRVVTVDPAPPAAPVVTAAVPATPVGVTVRWTAVAPATPAGRFRFEVVDPAGPYTVALLDADEVRTAADPQAFEAVVDPGAATSLAVAVVDPLGRRTTGTPFVLGP
jgi:hypothetical protein